MSAKKIGMSAILLIGLLVAAGLLWVKNANSFKREGTFDIAINDRPIKILRDDHGVAYVVAENKADAIRGQGFVVAQDRLFQVAFYRAIIKGKAASLAGRSMLESDIQMRVLDVVGNAKRSFQYLDAETKQVLNWYCEGFNAYLLVGKGEYPLELTLLGIAPQPLQPLDIVATAHFVGLFHSQNMADEIISLNLAASMESASEILPLNVNLDRQHPLSFPVDSLQVVGSGKKDIVWQSLPTPLLPYPKLGSNNWAVSGSKSQSGKPILANDPHVDARMLPGLFYPVGLFCPEFKASGIAVPGIPGLLGGRNEYVSFGITNAYGDSQDLFIEETEGDAYIQEGEVTPFQVRQETIEIKDEEAVVMDIRSTVRGPVISDFQEFGIMTDDVVSLRWSTAESQSSSLGIDRLLEAKTVAEVRAALTGMDVMFFNYAIADVEGNIAHQSTGLVPVRVGRQGAAPQSATKGDSWQGFIPKNELPHMVNPERGWIGTANHDTRPDGYPFYYSSHFSPYYRYQRMTEVLSADKKFVPEDLWKLILDTKNMQADALAPVFIEALEQEESTQVLADLLREWNYEDDIEEVGASVFNVLYNELVYLVLDDELPDEMEDMFWENVYYWNQRIDSLILTDHPFIDNVTTEDKESLSELIVQAGRSTQKLLEERFGDDPKSWTWGKIHTVQFVSPIRPSGSGKEMLGAELFPKKGSNQTLNRGGFVKNRERTFETGWFSSFRMVADMSDQEKMMGALAGGSSARLLHPYYKSQLDLWKSEEWIPYWISQEKIMENAKYELTLE
ncbi:MAG: penicillin acylase family protein [Bacteroidota bacterium]